ncbi:MAG TPA: MYXO-CTERM sorting domain-containing protein [Anaeromyxobacteraceae bacterium]|nr:MYXO-CTERM sorting domain-containing protein [Anaeromyxobacteraceae bacterium]
MTRIRRVALPATLLVLVSACSGSSKGEPRTARPEPVGAVVESMADGPFDAPPLALLRPSTPAARQAAWPARPWRAVAAREMLPAALLGPAAGETPAPRSPYPFSVFDGIGDGIAGYQVQFAPPDSTGAVGPTHYVEAVNSAFAVYDKRTGALLQGPADLQSLFASSGSGCASTNDGDPQVLYDQLADRWIVSQFSVASSSTVFWECVAVSKTGDPTGGWWIYSFAYPWFPDYPKMALWPDAYYVTYVRFAADAASYLGPEVCALDRSAMLEGRAATQQCVTIGPDFGPVLVASLDGADLPPAGAPAHVLSSSSGPTTPFGYLDLWAFHLDWQSPAASALTGPIHVATGPYAWPCPGSGLECVTQPGTSNTLDSLGDRLMNRTVYRNFGDHESLLASQTVLASGASGVRWWEIRDPSTSPAVHQEGTVSPDGAYRFMGSIAMDKVGNAAVGYSVSSGALSIYPGIAMSGRLAGDPPGTMPLGEIVLQPGIGHQVALGRWGDYSSMTIDPGDGCTFYYVNQFQPADGVFNWRTRIASFTLPGCTTAPDFTIGAAPATLTVARGTSATAAIATTEVSAAGTVGLSVAVTPEGRGVTASLDRASVAAGGSAVLTVAVTEGAVLGDYTVSVTGTEDPFVHAATISVTVPAPDFAIASAPAALAVARGARGTSTISTTRLVSAGTVDLAAAVSPDGFGVAASLDRSSVAAGGSAILEVTPSATATPGAYTVTVTGTEGSYTHAATVAVTVPAPDFTIASTPASLTVAPGDSGTSAVTTAVVNSGGTVTLVASVSPPGAGVTASLDRASIEAGGSAVLTVAASSAAVPGSYSILVTGAEGASAHGTTVAVTVPAPDFGISAAPASLTVIRGASGTCDVVTTQLVAPGAVGLTSSVAPAGAGVTASLDRASVAAGGSAVLTIAAAAGAAPGSYTVSVTGTEGPFTRSASVEVSVPAPDFAITASPAALTVSQDGTGTSTLTTTSVNGPGTVALAAAVAPGSAGVTATLDQGSVASGGVATVTVRAQASATPGSYVVTVTGTEGAFVREAAVAVTVPSPPAPGGGGCSTTGSNSGALLPLLAVFLVGGLRRRREG